ncbi:methyltransferase domain-containing protein [Candidatus Woesearchaeota archaeon]|nr:methyltransferase domain-containing protein [Candidatus Woesearchaeota archaeon]
MKRFTERKTEEYYDAEDKIYLSFWDAKGTCHFGLFTDDESHILAAENLTYFMIKNASINAHSIVLDVGCGDGEGDVQVVRKTGCKLVGIDVSGVRIAHAKQKAKQQKLDHVLKFFKSSATDLKYRDNSFTHVISQSSIYHVHDKIKALGEIYRVLQHKGIFVFDDLIKPQKQISKDAQKWVYERLLFDTPFSFTSYQTQLKKTGFEIIQAMDISQHMSKTYKKLIKILQDKIANGENSKYHERYAYLIKAYQKTIEATNKKEIGWAIYVCRKP